MVIYAVEHGKFNRIMNTIILQASAIKQLHDRKLAIDYLFNDQMMKLYKSINETATAEGYNVLPKQNEISGLKQNMTLSSFCV
jgi:hypothetical protein